MRRLATGVLALALTLCAGPAEAFWGASSTTGGAGRSTATTVNAGNVPTVTVAGSSVTVSWAASTLANGQTVGGYVVRRFDAATLTGQTVGSGCAGTRVTTTCTEASVPEGSWRYSVTPLVGTSWRGAESARSAATLVDVTAPTTALSLSSVSGGASKSANTVYYRGAAAGSLRVTDAVSDTSSGPASSSTAALGGTTTGWTHTASTVSTPTGGPYESNPFAWTAGATSSPTDVVTGTDASGNGTSTTLTFVNDSTGPAAGTISYTNGYATSPSVSVTFTTGADTGSGVASVQLQRAVATLTNGTCGAFGAFAALGSANPTSPYVDTAVGNSKCYQYRHLVTDQVGNVTTTTSASVARIDYSRSVLATSGLVSYWRLGEARVPPLVTSDTFTGTAGTLLQNRSGEVGASWTRFASSDSDAVLTASGTIRKSGTATKGTVYYSSGSPTAPNYTVAADVRLMTSVVHDTAGVVGRGNVTNSNGYIAGWDVDSGAWTLTAVVNGVRTILGTSTAQPLAAGSAARIQLVMNGTSLRVLVAGTQLISVTDSRVTAAGQAGVILGFDTASDPTTLSDTTGLQLDNLTMGGGFASALDSAGSNTGNYVNGTTQSTTAPFGVDADLATTLDGVDDYMQVPTPASLPTGASARSVEAWFKTSASTRQVVFDYGSRAADGQEFGLWLNAGGGSFTAYGGGSGQDRTFTVPGALDDGLWHSVVTTYDGTRITVFVDGTALTSQTATRDTAVDAYGFGIGAVLVQGDSGSGGFFSGSIDDVSVYNVALTAAQVTAHYALATAR